MLLNSITFVRLLDACANVLVFEVGMCVHEQIIENGQVCLMPLWGIAWLPCMQCGLDGRCLKMNSRIFQMWYQWDHHDNGTHAQCGQDQKEL